MTWLFGELDLDLTKTADEIYKQVFDIAEACGYMVAAESNRIIVDGNDLEKATIFFNAEKKAIKYKVELFTDRTGEIKPVSCEEVSL